MNLLFKRIIVTGDPGAYERFRASPAEAAQATEVNLHENRIIVGAFRVFEESSGD